MLAAPELDRSDDMTPSVQRHLVADLGQGVKDEPSGRDERRALVRAVDTTHGTVVHRELDHASGRDRRRIPSGTLAGQIAVTLGCFLNRRRGTHRRT